MWPFGKKEACNACGTQAKVSEMLSRRGQRFCSPACVQRFVNENPFPRPPGDDAQLRGELVNLIIAIGGEINRLHGAARSGDAAGHEEAMAASGRFLSLATETLPYLQALGFADAFARVDSIDIEAVVEGRRDTLHGAWAALSGVRSQMS